MPKKVLNNDLVKKYLEHIKNEKKVSEQTIKTYENIGKNIPFNLLNSQTTIIKKLKYIINILLEELVESQS